MADANIPEEWRPVVGPFAGWPYEVSSLGRVRRALTASAPSHRTAPGRIMRPIVKSTGYLCVSLHRNNSRRQATVHALVCAAFHGAPKEAGMQVGHEDGNPRNNAVGNLRWVTAKQNAEDRNRHGRTVRGEAVNTSRFTADDVLSMRTRAEAGESFSAIARDYDARGTTISSICARRSWKHL